MNMNKYRARKSAHECVLCGRPTELKGEKGYYSKCEICRTKERIRKRGQLGIKFDDDQKQTLCWSCKHAVPKMVDCKYVKGCSWSIEQKPVKGWAAEPHHIATDDVYSYYVQACPQFEKG